MTESNRTRPHHNTDKPPAPNGPRRYDWLFALVPLGALIVEIACFPAIIEDACKIERLTLTDPLKVGQPIDMGKFHLHQVRVSYGNLADLSYVSRLTSLSHDGHRSNAFVMAVLQGQDEKKIGNGALDQALLKMLTKADADALLQLLHEAHDGSPGSVHELELKYPGDAQQATGLNYIFVIGARDGSSQEARTALREALVETFERASNRHVTGLLMPCLTIAEGVPGGPVIDDFFRPLFDALALSTSPKTIDLSFWNGWSDEFQKKVRITFNDHWSTHAEKVRADPPHFYRFDFRLVLLALPICLVACLRRIQLNLRSFLIISGVFIGMLLGSFTTLEWALPAQSAGGWLLIAKSATALIEACGFPGFVGSIEAVFKAGDKG